jgi:HSP20 family protein
MFGKKKKKQNDEDDFFAAVANEENDGENTSDLASLAHQPEWIDQEQEEGQLSVDVFEEGDTIIVKSTIAGVEPDDIDIAMHDDMLTIRGERKQEHKQKGRDYFFQECYWGSFSRSIILPVEVDSKKIDATIKNGILTITLPKLVTDGKQKKINVKDKNS